MEAILDQLARLLVASGPWIVFATTFIETALFVGLLIPAEAVVLFAAVLASAGKFSILSVLLATFLGALLGDQTGYVIGRKGGSRFVAKQGYIAKLWGWYQPIAARLFRRHPLFSVSMARFISFVRTLMPWFAGRDRMPYGRFLFYDFLGVLGWSSASVAVGYAAGESWRVVAQRIGSATAYILGGILAISLFIEMRRRVRVRMMNKRGITRVALTGNIASGKTTVTEVWRDLGAHVIDADVLARRAIQPGTNGFHEVARVFGRGLISNGEIDRTALRQIVFADEVKRKQLEAIIHPEVARLRQAEELRISATGVRLIVSDIPLLFETGLDADYDIIVLVDAPEAIRVER
ncbi:MAG TPA: dephospho-CoA kinase, partial [Longimicrobiales bacterium]|nr:dephospho-CoA kinase [Longimicrobiales bacterium]